MIEKIRRAPWRQAVLHEVQPVVAQSIETASMHDLEIQTRGRQEDLFDRGPDAWRRSLQPPALRDRHAHPQGCVAFFPLGANPRWALHVNLILIDGEIRLRRRQPTVSERAGKGIIRLCDSASYGTLLRVAEAAQYKRASARGQAGRRRGRDVEGRSLARRALPRAEVGMEGGNEG